MTDIFKALASAIFVFALFGIIMKKGFEERRFIKNIDDYNGENIKRIRLLNLRLTIGIIAGLLLWLWILSINVSFGSEY